jgi:hypothetical protein
MEYCSFIEHYKEFSQGNETPEIIHIWTAMSVLAGAIEKRVWIDQKFFKIYPNMYIVFIAPPGICAKSTSMALGQELLEETGRTVFSSFITKEAIITNMLEHIRTIEIPDGTFSHTSVTLIADELNVLLSSGMDMVKFLVEIWGKDKAYEYKTKTAGTFNLPYPNFNLIGAVVPQWFGDCLANDMNSTGLLARCIFVYEDVKRGKYPECVMTNDQMWHRKKLLEHIFALDNLYGEVHLQKDTKKIFHDWYMEQEIDSSEDYRIASYLERRTKVHILKVAMLMALGELRTTIKPIDFERAVRLLERTERKMRMTYVLAGANPLAIYVSRIINMLDLRTTPIPIRELMELFYTELTPDQFKLVLRTIADMEIASTVLIKDSYYLEKRHEKIPNIHKASFTHTK